MCSFPNPIHKFTYKFSYKYRKMCNSIEMIKIKRCVSCALSNFFDFINVNILCIDTNTYNNINYIANSNMAESNNYLHTNDTNDTNNTTNVEYIEMNNVGCQTDNYEYYNDVFIDEQSNVTNKDNDGWNIINFTK